jgi:hypothetical protein
MMGVIKKRWQIENGNSESVRGNSYVQLRNSPVQDICAGELMKGYNEVGTCCLYWFRRSDSGRGSSQ